MLADKTNNMIHLETERLLLREFKAADFPHFKTVFTNPETARYIGGVKNQEQIWRLLACYIGHWQMKGYGKMAVVEKETQRFVGCAGLWDSDPWPELELGYWFLNEMQGKGYATEAATAVKNFAFAKLEAATLVSYIHPANLASIKLATRLGGVMDKTIDLLDFGPHQVFRYSA